MLLNFSLSPVTSLLHGVIIPLSPFGTSRSEAADCPVLYCPALPCFVSIQRLQYSHSTHSIFRAHVLIWCLQVKPLASFWSGGGGGGGLLLLQHAHSPGLVVESFEEQYIRARQYVEKQPDAALGGERHGQALRVSVQ